MEATAIHNLIRQRHPTPLCRGLNPYCGENSEPGRYITESLTSGPELENSQGHERRFGPAPTMSRLPLIADVETSVGGGREGPHADIPPLSSVSARRISRRLQDALHYVLADLAAHVLSHSGRETIVETRANAGLGDFAVHLDQIH